MFFKNKYKTLNLIEIDKKALIGNYDYFQKLQPSSFICPVLKSNAYGHGLKLVGKFVDKEIKPEFLCVDSLYEAYELRKSGVKGKILIIGYTFPDNFKHKKIDFSLPVFDLETLSILNKHQPGIKVHLKIDTGMNRLGIKEGQYELFAQMLKKNNKVEVEGIYSHLSDSDNQNETFTKHQINKFKDAISFFENNGFVFKYKHLFATAGAIKFNDPKFNLVRLGIGFYGLSPFPKDCLADSQLKTNLKPVLKFKTYLAGIKEVQKNEFISYANTFKAEKEMKIGILALGYYDGLDRRFSNKGSVLYKDIYCPIVGNVCMNITLIDLTEVKNPKVGDEIIVYSANFNDKNSINNASFQINTIPYNLLVNFSETTRRRLI